jgi:hypothetical protein
MRIPVNVCYLAVHHRSAFGIPICGNLDRPPNSFLRFLARRSDEDILGQRIDAGKAVVGVTDLSKFAMHAAS